MPNLSENLILSQWEYKWCIAGYGCLIFKDKHMNASSEHFNNIRAKTVIKAAHEGKVLPRQPALKDANARLFFCMRSKKHKGRWMKRCQARWTL